MNRVVLITAAARGIGAATARELATKGATVAITGIDNSPAGEAVMLRRTAGVMPALDADVEALDATEPIEQGT